MNKATGFILIVVVVAAVGFMVAGAGKKDQTNAEKKTADVTETVASTGSDEEGSGLSADYIEGLAKYLTEKGAVLYGAYWCSHCQSQKKMFGSALQYVNYVECDNEGENANPDECVAKGIEAYPTWIYDGQMESGVKSLVELADMVGYSPTSANGSSNQSATAEQSSE